jgi:hypothetical protein
MRRCAFLTLSDPADYVIDDDLARKPLAALGWQVDAVPWSAPGVDWSAFEAVVIRSPWDYQDHPEAFLEVLAEIDRSDAVLMNRLDLVRWNLDKTYLRELEAAGVPIVPTRWRERLAPGDAVALGDEMGGADLVVKPTVSANADGAFWLGPDAPRERFAACDAYFADRALLAQPFVPSVVEEGEFSVFYFDGAYSHTILKTPKRGDFRVQEEHGGLIQAVRPEPALLRAAEAAMRAIGDAPLYARPDFVRAPDGGFWLMEFELIEPGLYLRMDADAPRRFAEALDRRMA